MYRSKANVGVVQSCIPKIMWSPVLPSYGTSCPVVLFFPKCSGGVELHVLHRLQRHTTRTNPHDGVMSELDSHRRRLGLCVYQRVATGAAFHPLLLFSVRLLPSEDLHGSRLSCSIVAMILSHRQGSSLDEGPILTYNHACPIGCVCANHGFLQSDYYKVMLFEEIRNLPFIQPSLLKKQTTYYFSATSIIQTRWDQQKTFR